MDVRDQYRQQIERALVLALVFFVLGLLTIVTIALWHFLTYIAGAILLIGCGVLGFEMFMRWERHKVDLEARRNKALIVHESEHGYGYISGPGQISGYSHSLASQPLLSMGPGFAMEPLPQKPEAPRTFGEMVQGGYISPGLDYVLGFDEQSEPIRMPTITSLGVGGFPGAGKTVTTLLLMLETIIKYDGRVRFLVVDPHKYASGGESLGARTQELTPFFLTLQDVRTTVPPDDMEYHALLDWANQSGLSSVVEGGEEMKGWLAILEIEMKRRVRGKEGDMWVVVFDEFASIMDGPESKRVAEVLKKMNREARKLKMFALLSSVDWKANNAGGTDVRNAIASFVLHGMPQALAELIAPPQAAKQVPFLAPGEMVLYNVGQITRGRVPMVTAGDAIRVVQDFYPRSLATGVYPAQVQITEVAE